MLKNKVRAYTLMEIVIAMLISAICASLCYTVYGLIQQYYARFNEKNQQSNSVVELKHAMEQDFEKATLLIGKEASVICIQDSLSVTYLLSGKHIVREIEALRKDTFDIAVINTKCYFENLESLADTIDRIDLIVAIHSGNQIPLRIIKRYSSNELYSSKTINSKK